MENRVKKHRNCVHTFKIPKMEKGHRKVRSVAIKWYNYFFNLK